MMWFLHKVLPHMFQLFNLAIQFFYPFLKHVITGDRDQSNGLQSSPLLVVIL